MSGRCGRADVLGDAGVRLFGWAFAVVIVIGVIRDLGGSALCWWGGVFEVGRGAAPFTGIAVALSAVDLRVA